MTESEQERKNLIEQAVHVWDLLQKALAEKGEDYIYVAPYQFRDVTSCRYLEYLDNATMEIPVRASCIVGHVLVAEGDEFSQIETQEGYPAFDLISDLHPDWHPSVAAALNAAQEVQDLAVLGDSQEKYTWGNAVQAYRRYLLNGHDFDVKFEAEKGDRR